MDLANVMMLLLVHCDVVATEKRRSYLGQLAYVVKQFERMRFHPGTELDRTELSTGQARRLRHRAAVAAPVPVAEVRRSRQGVRQFRAG